MSSSDGSSNEIYRGSPLRDPLVDAGFGHVGEEKLMELKFNPEKIVRISRHLMGDTLEQLKVHLSVLEELRDEYGINIAPVNVFVGPNILNEMSLEDLGYVVTDRIHGKQLNQVEFKPEEIEQASGTLDSLFRNIIRYYGDKMQSGSWYMSDLAHKNTQFIWGKRKGETEDKPYLVDLGPTALLLPSKNPQRGEQLLNSIFVGGGAQGFPRNGVYRDILEMEYQLGNVRLEGSREKLKSFVEIFLESEGLGRNATSRANDLKDQLSTSKK